MKSSLSSPFDILMLGLSNWNNMATHNTRCKQFTLHFAQNEHIRKVVHVSPIRPMSKNDHLMLILHHLHHQKKGVFFPPCRLTQVSEKLFDLFIGYPFISPKFIDLLFAREKMIIRALKKMISILKMDNLILWIASPTEHYLIGKLGEQFSIFDTVDDLSLAPDAYPGGGEMEVKKCYASIDQKADLILTNSKKMLGLFNRKENIYNISNGTEVERFRKVMEGDYPEPGDIKDIPHPRIAYTGSFTDRVDNELLHFLAKRNRGWSIILIGYIGFNVDIEELLENNNVISFGPKPFKEIPYYLKTFDVCLIPMKVNSLTHSMDPMKAYDYLAAGKEVVATNLHELKKYGDLMKIGKTYEEFEAHIRESINSRLIPEVVSRRLDFVKNQTWEAKVKQIMNIINKFQEQSLSRNK